jgi:hypothetical protein
VTNLVGSKDVEVTLGDTINMIRAKAVSFIPYKPNIILINAGTNNCRLATDDEALNSRDRMRALINTLRSSPDMKATLIILSTLIPSNNPKIK